MMPGEPGISIFKLLANNPETSRIPTILMSGYPLKDVQSYVPKAIIQKNHFISKPISWGVSAKIEEVLKEPPGEAVPEKSAPSGLGRVLKKIGEWIH
jgi:response regulator RpfG family c-di-GMP phosphodiesterase